MYLFRINKKVVLRVCGKKLLASVMFLFYVFFDFLLFYFSDDVCMYMTISECVRMCVSD